MKFPDPKDILRNWLTEMSDQNNATLENLKKDMDSDNHTYEHDMGYGELLDVESVKYVHVDQEYYQEELYDGMSSGKINSLDHFK